MAARCGGGEDAREQQHDRSCGRDLGRTLVEVPVGFKWFVRACSMGSFGFGGEESAGARSCCAMACVDNRQRRHRHGSARGRDHGVTGEDPSDPTGIYSLVRRACLRRIDTPATPPNNRRPAVTRAGRAFTLESKLAGDPIRAARLTTAPGQRLADRGDPKIVTDYDGLPRGRRALSPSTSSTPKSFRGAAHLRRIQDEARAILLAALG